MRKINIESGGFTLLEMLVYLFIFSLVLSVCIPVLYILISQGNAVSEKTLNQADMMFVAERMSYEISHAQSAVTRAATSSQISFTSETGNAETIFLNANKMELTANGTTSILNSSSVPIADLLFDFSNYASTSEIKINIVGPQKQNVTFSVFTAL